MSEGTLLFFQNQKLWALLSNPEDLWYRTIFNLAEAWLRIAEAIKLVRLASCLPNERVRWKLSYYNTEVHTFGFSLKKQFQGELSSQQWGSALHGHSGTQFPLPVSPSSPRLGYYCHQDGQSWVTISPEIILLRCYDCNLYQSHCYLLCSPMYHILLSPFACWSPKPMFFSSSWTHI